MTVHGDDPLFSLRPAVALLATAGFLLGTAYFATLRRSVLITIERRSGSQYLLLALARMAAAALVFTFAARFGVPALLGAFAGFLVARQLAVRAARRAA